jgi:hypothetical protein
MRKLIIAIITIAFLLTSCGESTPSVVTESPPVETPPITAIPDIVDNTEKPDDKHDNNKDEVTINVPEIFIDSRAALGDILGVDFTGIKITEILYDVFPDGHRFTEIYLFCIVNEDTALYERLKRSRIGPDDLIRGDILDLERAGLSKTDIQSRAWHFKEITPVSDEIDIVGYSIELYLLKEPRADGSNVFITSGPDAKVTIDVEKILAE